MRPWVLVLVATGCFSKPDEPHQVATDAATTGPDAAPDAFTTVDCSQTLFTGVAQQLEGTAGYSDGDPAITDDKRQLFFVHFITTAMVHEIWTTTRTDANGTFVTPTKLELGGAASDNDVDPAPTADGSLFVFLRNGYPQLATKTAAVTSNNPTPGTWSVQPLPGPLMTVQMGSIDLSPDGKTLYWATPNKDLHIAVLNPTTSQFEDQGGTYGSGFDFPTVSADGKELYFWDQSFLRQTTRPSTTSVFPYPGSVQMPACIDPDLSADGEMLVCFDNNGVSALIRTCPPPQ
jgi:hypothetical protein